MSLKKVSGERILGASFVLRSDWQESLPEVDPKNLSICVRFSEELSGFTREAEVRSNIFSEETLPVPCRTEWYYGMVLRL